MSQGPQQAPSPPERAPLAKPDAAKPGKDKISRAIKPGTIGMIGPPNSGKTALLVAVTYASREPIPKWDRGFNDASLTKYVAEISRKANGLWKETAREDAHRHVTLFAARHRIWRWFPRWVGNRFPVTIPEMSGELVRVLAGYEKSQNEDEARRTVELRNYLAECSAIVVLIDSTQSPARFSKDLATIQAALAEVLKHRTRKTRLPVCIGLTKCDELSQPAVNRDEVRLPEAESSLAEYLQRRGWEAVGRTLLRTDGDLLKYSIEQARGAAGRDTGCNQAIALDYLQCQFPDSAGELRKWAGAHEVSVRLSLVSAWGRPLQKQGQGFVFPDPAYVKPQGLLMPLGSVLDRIQAQRQQRRLWRLATLAVGLVLLIGITGPWLTATLLAMARSNIKRGDYATAETEAKLVRIHPLTAIASRLAPRQVEGLANVYFRLAQCRQGDLESTSPDVDKVLELAGHAVRLHPDPRDIVKWRTSVLIDHIKGALTAGTTDLALDVLRRSPHVLECDERTVNVIEDTLTGMCGNLRESAKELVRYDKSDADATGSVDPNALHRRVDTLRNVLDGFDRGDAFVRGDNGPGLDQLHEVIKARRSHLAGTEALMELAGVLQRPGANAFTFRASVEKARESRDLAIASGRPRAIRESMTVLFTVVDAQVEAVARQLDVTALDKSFEQQGRYVDSLRELGMTNPSHARLIAYRLGQYQDAVVRLLWEQVALPGGPDEARQQYKSRKQMLDRLTKDRPEAAAVESDLASIRAVLELRLVQNMLDADKVPDAAALEEYVKVPGDRIAAGVASLKLGASSALRRWMADDNWNRAELRKWKVLLELLKPGDDELGRQLNCLRVAWAFSDQAAPDAWTLEMDQVVQEVLCGRAFKENSDMRRDILRFGRLWAAQADSFAFGAALYRGLGKAQQRADDAGMRQIRAQLRKNLFGTSDDIRRRPDFDAMMAPLIELDLGLDPVSEEMASVAAFVRTNPDLSKCHEAFRERAQTWSPDQRDCLFYEDFVALRNGLLNDKRAVPPDLRDGVSEIDAPKAQAALKAIDGLKTLVDQYSLLFVSKAGNKPFYLARDELTVQQIINVIKLKGLPGFQFDYRGTAYGIGKGGDLSKTYRERLPAAAGAGVGAFGLTWETAVDLVNAIGARLPTSSEWLAVYQTRDRDEPLPRQIEHRPASGAELAGWGDTVPGTGHRGLSSGLREWVVLESGHGLLGGSWWERFAQDPAALSQPDGDPGLLDVGVRLAADAVPLELDEYLRSAHRGNEAGP